MYFILIFLFIGFTIYGNQLDNFNSINLKKAIIIQNLKDDPAYLEMKEGIKKHLRKNQKDIKFYKYTIQSKEDFYFIMAKTSLDHTTLLSLNFELQNYTLKDFTPNKEIYLVNYRGTFSKTNELNQPHLKIYIEDLNQILYFYPNIKNLNLYHQNFESNNSKETKNNSELKDYLFPLNTKEIIITSPFGWRKNPITGKIEFHKGVDIKASNNTEIFAPVDAKVVFSGFKKGYGNTIILRTKKEFFLFAHLSGINVQNDKFVKKGEIIGRTGNSGFTTGPHLHFEYKLNSKYLDPMSLYQN